MKNRSRVNIQEHDSRSPCPSPVETVSLGGALFKVFFFFFRAIVTRGCLPPVPPGIQTLNFNTQKRSGENTATCVPRCNCTAGHPITPFVVPTGPTNHEQQVTTTTAVWLLLRLEKLTCGTDGESKSPTLGKTSLQGKERERERVWGEMPTKETWGSLARYFVVP